MIIPPKINTDAMIKSTWMVSSRNTAPAKAAMAGTDRRTIAAVLVMAYECLAEEDKQIH